jgi:hypothetical protein
MCEHLKFECEVLTAVIVKIYFLPQNNAELSGIKLPRLPDYTALDFSRH